MDLAKVKVLIRHESGPLRGQVLEFEDSGQRIKIGRDPDSEIQYPADLTEVGRSHADLKWNAGHLELDVNTRNPVYVDGSATGATDGLELRDGAVIQLGVGPRLSIRYVRPGGMPVTHDGSVKKVLDDAERLQRVGKRNLWAMAATGVLAVAVLLVVWYSGKRFEDAIARTKASVYLVVVKSELGEEALGTAWVAGEGYLATNAHVAAGIDQALSFGLIPLVRSATSPSTDLEIVGTVYHPGYGAFYEAFYNARPLQPSLEGEEREVEDVGGYDVALLMVDDTSKLAPPIPIASRARLREIAAGLPVACIGFPTDGLAAKDIAEPTPTSQTASITGVTTFTRTRPTDGDGQLLEHSIPAIGGYSGGPIIDKRGEVIGVLNGGNVVLVPIRDSNDDESMSDLPDDAAGPDGKREMKWMKVNNAALVNFGQRADVLLDLMEHGPDMDMEALRASWQRDFDRYSRRAAESQPATAQALLQSWAGDAEPIQVASESFSIAPGDQLELLGTVLTGKDIEFFAPEGNYFIVASADTADDLDLIVTEPDDNFGSILAEDETKSRIQPPRVHFSVKSPKPLSVIVHALTLPLVTEADSALDQPDLTLGTNVRLNVWRLPLERE